MKILLKYKSEIKNASIYYQNNRLVYMRLMLDCPPQANPYMQHASYREGKNSSLTSQ